MSDLHTETDDSIPATTPTTPRFQFSLAWLLIAVTAVAVVLGVGQILGQTIVEYIGTTLYAVIVGCILPTPFVVAALFARGDARVFSIGALVPWIGSRGTLPVYIAYQSRWPGWVLIVGSTIFMLVTAGICGFVAVAAHRWIQRHGYGP
jgi:hypothetical protein